MNLSDFRIQYSKHELRRKDLLANPVEQFKKWFQEAISHKIKEPNAMSLATSNQQGKPSCRTVLLKKFDEQGFAFFTNYESRKAQDIEQNPLAALVFNWIEMERQVIIHGSIIKTSTKESQAYFSSRPRHSQLGAAASHQDAPLASRQILEMEYKRLEKLYEGKEIPLPSFWGGFRLIPSYFEFWQGRADRLHDRFSYTLQDQRWAIQRLSP